MDDLEKLKQNQTMDPKTKEGQGLDFWAKGLLEQGMVTREVYDDFIRQNNSKEEAMEKHGLPQLKHYGFFSSAEEIKERIVPGEDERFIIRCVLKADPAIIKRRLDATFDQICDFVEDTEQLPGGFEKWNVEVKEFRETIAAGTIIISPSGKTIIETWKGRHLDGVSNIPKYSGEFDPNAFDMHFRWTTPSGGEEDLVDMQKYALKALRYVFPDLKPQPDEALYLEYVVDPQGRVSFIDVNDSSIVTGKN